MMKADTVLDYAVFQLTPTRTRCELLISSKGVTEKLASGLLKPFLSHLRAAEEQLAVGGYSIKLEPPTDGQQSKASWFTKGTMQRFVRFVSTPEVLERVTAVESELLRLEEELDAYSHEGDEYHAAVDPTANGSGGKKSGTPGKFRKDVTEDAEPESNETSRSRLLKAMEARQSMLRREQGMAFARAVAAGFDVDHLPNLIAFADNFGATRLREACLRFTALCRKQQESGLWLDEMELVAAEGALPFSDTNGAGITIAPGMDTFASLKDEEDDSTSIKCVDHVGKDHPDNHHQKGDRQADHPTYPPMIGMLPGQMPPYAAGPWMQFGNDQAYDPRYFSPQNMAMPPFANGGYPPVPYWSQDSWRGHPSPGTAHNAHEEEEDEEESAEKTISKKSGRKSSPRRRTSPLKKIQVGRSGKRSGMVLIRNINYITSQQDGNKSKSTGSERNDSDDVSDAVSDSDEQGQSEHDRKKTTHKKHCSAEASSEEASRSDGKTDTYGDVFVMPERAIAHPGAGLSFENEALLSQQGKQQPSSGSTTDESFILETGRSYGRSGGHYDFDDQMVSAGTRQRVSEDGLLLPQRIHGHQSSTNRGSELGFSAGRAPQPEHEKQSVDDSFIIPLRGDQAETVQSSSEVVFENGGSGPHDSRVGSAFDEFFIVPSRSNAEGAGESARRTLELEEQLYAEPKEKVENKAPKVEPDDVWMLPERSTGKESLEKRWRDVDYDMEAMSSLQNKPVEEDNNEFYDQYHEQRNAKLMKESGSKKAEREAKMKSLQENLDKRKAEISARVKPTRSSILKSKKEREEEERKRIEELAAQRRNRIAARTGGTGSTTAASRTSSATVHRSLSSSSANKVPSASSTRNPLARSVPSLAPLKKENAKPSAAKPTPSRSPLPTNEDKKRETLRKSIASARELKKPGTPADAGTMLGKSSTAALHRIGAAA